MKAKYKAMMTLTMIALVVSILNGVADLTVKLHQTFRASAATPSGEKLLIKVKADSGRPPFLWALAWRVSGQVVTNVSNGITIQVQGSNIESPVTVDYWIEARKPDGTVLGKTLQASGISCNVGGSVSDSTGSIDIDQHLSNLGLSTTQDQTIDYYVWVKVTAVGLISGQQLVAEVGPVKFDAVTFNYGVEAEETIEASADTYVSNLSPDTNYGTASTLYSDADNFITYIKFDLPAGLTAEDIISATLRLKIDTPSERYQFFFRVTESWDENTTTWNTRPEFATDWEITDSYPDTDGAQTVYTDITPIVKAWLNTANYGLATRCNEPGATIIYSREHSYSTRHPKLILNYYDWSASWSWYPLPLSIVSMPIGRQIVLGLIAGITCFTAIVTLSRRGKR